MFILNNKFFSSAGKLGVSKADENDITQWKVLYHSRGLELQIFEKIKDKTKYA